MHKPPYILLIDDDEDDLDLLSSEMQKKGIKVKTFDSSVKALIYLTLMSDNRELPALIIIDYNMPKKNGWQVLSLIKSNRETKDIPVVMYSTAMTDLLKKQLSNAGAVDCLNKAWNCKELDKQVQGFQEMFSHLTDKM
jgi:CheY-like chemotaxis protein